MTDTKVEQWRHAFNAPISAADDRLIRRDELKTLVPASDPTLWRWEKAGKFPKRVTLSRNFVAWRLSEVQAWIAAQGREAA